MLKKEIKFKMRSSLIFLYLFFTVSSHEALANTENAIKVVDYVGNTVTLNAPAKRVVALAPHIVENLFTVELGDSLIGVVEYSDFPEAAKEIPRIGGAYSLSVEKILSLQPDVVYVWLSGNGEKIANQLKSFGVPVYLDNPHSLNDLKKSLIDLATLGGNEALGIKKAEEYDSRLSELKNKYDSQMTKSAFYQIWNKPLQTLNGKHIVSDVLRICGVQNIFANAIPVAPKVSLEAVIKADPDFIIAAGKGNKRPDSLIHWQKYPELSAVKKDNFAFVHPDLIHRHTVRILQGTKILCEQLQ